MTLTVDICFRKLEVVMKKFVVLFRSLAIVLVGLKFEFDLWALIFWGGGWGEMKKIRLCKYQEIISITSVSCVLIFRRNELVVIYC